MPKTNMFKYEATIHCKAGKGGDGLISYDIKDYHIKGQPFGGNGGKGGNIYIIATKNEEDLSSVFYNNVHKAMDGKNGESNRRSGHRGDDLYIKVPLHTRAFIADQNFFLGEVKFVNDKLLLAKGGDGGVGNAAMHNSEKYNRDKGQEGEELYINLRYTIEADFAIVGSHNVGKSLLFNTLIDNNRSEVADYMYTTKKPIPGIIDDDITPIKILDTPAFEFYDSERYIKYIEGVTKFLYVLDMTVEDHIEKFLAFKYLLFENNILIPIILVINKIDLVEDFENSSISLISNLKAIGVNNYCFISAKEGTNIHNLITLIKI